MEKILFITAPYHCGVVEVAGSWIPLNFAYLSRSAKEAGLKSYLFDAMSKNVGFKGIKEMIINLNPDFLCLSSITPTLKDNIKIASIAKKINGKIKVVLGGVHPTFMYEEILSENNCIDFIILGEGEYTLYELLKNLKENKSIEDVKGLAYKRDGNIIVNKRRNFLEDLELFPPFFEILPWEDYVYYVLDNSRLGAISTSRGCNHNCIFCSQQKFWEKTWRGREPKKVIEEIKELYKGYGVRTILFVDEYPTKDKERWEEILKGVISLKFKDLYLLMETRVDDILRDETLIPLYKKAGIVHIYLGLEAGEQETLDLIKKETKVQMGYEALRLLQKYEIISETSFIIGFPNETISNIRKTVELAKFYNPDFAHFLFITPWPYSDLWGDVKEYVKVFDYSKYNLIEPIIEPKNLSLDDLNREILKCYKDFYLWKFKNLKNKNNFNYKYISKSFKLMMKSSFIKQKLLKNPSFKLNYKNGEKFYKVF